ncbi:MAG: hypothetical protein V3V75_04605 [Thermoguttaceae bacterium]
MAKRKAHPSQEQVWQAAVACMLYDDGLRTDQFRSAWFDFVEHRRQINRELTPMATLRVIRKLERFGHDKAIAAIGTSIESRWTGVFEPRDQTPARSAPSKGVAKRRRRTTAADRGEYPEDGSELPKL